MSDSTRPNKRRRVESSRAHDEGDFEDIAQLYSWTEFIQSTDISIRDGLIAFKDWLASISDLDDLADQSSQFRRVKQYCDWEIKNSHGQTPFYNIISTWFFAIENNVESIISAVPSVLAQFLRTISGIIELREPGLALVDHLLSREQAKLFEKCFHSPRNKANLSSPCIRLLTEMMTFDAGARATAVWLRKDVWIHKLDTMLEQRNTDTSSEKRTEPSLRRMSLRFVIAGLRYLDASAKTSLLFQARVFHVFLSGSIFDGADVLSELLRLMERRLLKDEAVSREAVRSFFTPLHLDMLVKLYGFVSGDDVEAKNTVRETVHSLLLQLCTTSDGLCIVEEQATGLNDESNKRGDVDEDFIDLGFDSPYYEVNSKTASVKQSDDLIKFTAKLRFFNDDLQKDLCVAILQSWPTILPQFVSQFSSLPTTNSDDASWRTQFAFWFSMVEVVNLPLPTLPTPESLQQQLESILPIVLDRQHLSSMLASKDRILQISAARFLVTVLQKFHNRSQLFHKQDNSWQQFIERFTASFEERLPQFRDVSQAMQQTSVEDGDTVNSLLECLSSYANILPHTVAATPFNVSPIMNMLCERVELNASSGALDLQNLVRCASIALSTNSTKWFHKSAETTLSPSTTLLQLSLSLEQTDAKTKLQHIVGSILADNGVITNGIAVSKALYVSLTMIDLSAEDARMLFMFLDNCIVRTQQRPVKYLDIIEAASQLVSDRKPLCLLVATVVEQFNPCFTKIAASGRVIKATAKWMAHWFQLLEKAGENYRVMTCLQEDMLTTVPEETRKYLSKAFAKAVRKGSSSVDLQADEDVEMEQADLTVEFVLKDDLKTPHLKELLEEYPTSLDGLDKWSAAEIDIEFDIASGRLGRLIRCVGSHEDEVRLQAFQTLQSVCHIVDTASTHPEKRAVWLVLSELCQTVRDYGLTNPMPTIAVEVACEFVQIMIDPTHAMYIKANKFILARPAWSSRRIIHYWIDRTLHQEPSNDDHDATAIEVTWLLNLLLRGLRGVDDLNLYRQTGVWEKVGSLYSSTTSSVSDKNLILSLLERAIKMPGGADMLLTRFGIGSWLQMQAIIDRQRSGVIHKLQEEIQSHSDQATIEAWKRSCPLTKVQA